MSTAFDYADAPHRIPRLTPIYIFRFVMVMEDDEIDAYVRQLEIPAGIPVNGNRDARLWGGKDTAITYAMQRYTDAPARLALLLELLYCRCGIPVSGTGSGTQNLLRLCALTRNVRAAAFLLRRTDARYEAPRLAGTRLNLQWMGEIDSMIRHGDTEMLRLFAEYRARTFPDAAAYLNRFGGRRAEDIPLFIAALRGDARLVHVLIYGFGADLEIRDREGRTAFDMLSDMPQSTIRDKIMRILRPQERLQAALMSQHPRLGSGSAMSDVSAELLQRIHDMSLREFPE
jgi:hypothetical protein